uniref:DNL-type domain-containing protein n=1 Tax=Oryza punctata TaxID=4537 RepID=A0A0E0JKX1_ORYPU
MLKPSRQINQPSTFHPQNAASADQLARRHGSLWGIASNSWRPTDEAGRRLEHSGSMRDPYLPHQRRPAPAAASTARVFLLLGCARRSRAPAPASRFEGDFWRREAGRKGEEKRTLPAMATTAAAYGCPAAPPFAASVSRRRAPPSRVSLNSSSSSSRRRTAEFPGLRVSCRRRILAASACSGEADSDAVAAPAEGTFDLNLPRRSLLVQFTCNACGERTKRLINRVAYERGTIFLQCAGCQVYHKFVDNLGLVVEYDLREENRRVGRN